MKLCSKCKKRPAVVFMSNPLNPNAEPEGLCLMCAKELGIKPVDDMLKSMNISDEDIEMMSNQFLEAVSDSDMMLDDESLNDETFDMGTAPAIPFLKNIFGGSKDKEDNDENTKQKQAKGEKSKKKKKFLDQYCNNLTLRAREGKLDTVIGRDKELDRMLQILSRRSKNNPCLIGEPGVGKTAIVEGLAIKIVNGTAPARLLDKEILLLDLTSLVAGTQFRGQFESRVKGLIEEVKDAGNIILFIDEIHNLVGAGDSAEGSMNAANILKPALSRGEIQVIGATTFKEYRKYIEKDAALERRFQPITVEEPSITEAVNVMLGIKPYYEGYHTVTIPDTIVEKAVYLSERYVTDRFLPDKAIDLLDEACACASLENKAIDDLYIANKKVAEYSKQLDELAAEVENPDYEKQAMVKSNLEKYRTQADSLCEAAANNTVTERHLATVIEMWTGIPASKIEENELSKLARLEDVLNEHIIGQKDATRLVANAVKRSRVKTSALRRPASFIFVGPTGVGKTALVKVLSEQLFDTPETFIRLDMSEFMEKHSVSRLIGAPPGYVGYDEAGQLTEKVRRKPYSVILVDEIEKAHPDVLNILLQILDEGRITDAHGRTVNFENTIIVMTSNAGSERNDNLLGFGKTVADASKEKALKALREFLRPEFIARVDEIVVFNPLTVESLQKIAEIMLNELCDALKERNIIFDFDKDITKYIAEKCNGTKTGARELRNIIRREIESPVVDMIISKSQVKKITATISDGQLILK
ncbi:MAG: ATP-dependent Clp protease ATP-binding subunit [Clostridia bacterium]|nr:ATP-dependent Clp protease ATP-binding subunit [Clostridia bacterium]MBR3591900.1 ATP-dependent Clp protease ATP-binding subunit [Clostridia bacterium]